MKLIFGILGFVVAPYIVFYEFLTGKWKSNSGHTSGLAHGFMTVIAVVSGIIQFIVALLILITFLFFV